MPFFYTMGIFRRVNGSVGELVRVGSNPLQGALPISLSALYSELQNVCLICGFNYFMDFSKWREMFEVLLKEDPENG